jgi:hypothetical protein
LHGSGLQRSLRGQKAFEALAADASVEQPLRELARLRAAMIAVDSEPYDAIVKRVGDLATPGHMWRSSAREVLGLSAFKAGDMDKAGAHYQDIALDPEAPQQMKTRAEIVIEMTRGLSTK